MTAVVISRMTVDEATACVEAIKDHLSNTRSLLVDLYEREGWLALGYTSWRQCVLCEFEQHQSQLYRLLSAGLIEREISPVGEMGVIPERQLRELAALDDPALRNAAWQAAQSQEKVTAQIVKQAVKAAADWANEYIVTRGHTSLDGESLEVAKAAITERMLETRQRQQQHIAASIEAANGLSDDTKYTGKAAVVSVDKHRHFMTLIVPDDLLNGVEPGEVVNFAIYVKGK